MNQDFKLPSELTIPDLIKTLRELCWGASDILKAYARGEQPPYGFSRVLSVKDNGKGPVSAADLAVNKWLLDGFNSYYPDIDWKILSEETSENFNNSYSSFDNKLLWILDPLDGTKDFLSGTGEYAVHLALVENNRPKLGIVLIPEREELWFGISGLGSWCEDRNQNRKEVSFNSKKNINDLILVTSRSHRDQRLENLISSLNFSSSKAVGSVGCKIATILRGEADVYISLSAKTAPKDWDMAAPEALLISAGGCFTHADQSNLKYNQSDNLQAGCLIASNGFIHEDICKESLLSLKNIDPNFQFYK